MHACETNEILLLVADVFASICCEIEGKRNEGILDEKAIITNALRYYHNFVRNPWWECAIQPVQEDGSDVNESPENFAEKLRLLVSDTWAMLRQVLDLDDRGLTDVLSMDYLAR